MNRMSRVLLMIGLCSAAAAGQEKGSATKPPTNSEAAAQVLAAHKAKDAIVLATLASRENPDPWYVADALCARGEHDAAAAFAKASSRPDVAELPAYVASRRGKPDNGAARAALNEAHRLLNARKLEAGLAVLRAADVTERDVVAALNLNLRGAALHFSAQPRPKESAASFVAAGKRADDMGWLRLAARAYYMAGCAASSGGDWSGAKEAWTRCLLAEEKRANRAGVAAVVGPLGVAHFELGETTKALAYQRRALALNEELRNEEEVIAALGNEAKIHDRLGDYAKAVELLERALGLAHPLPKRALVADILGNLASAHANLGDHGKALVNQQRALKIRIDLGDRVGAAHSLIRIGSIWSKLGEVRKAATVQDRGLALMEAAGDPAGIATACLSMGAAKIDQGEYDEALRLFERCRAIREKLGDREGAATALSNSGAVHMSAGRSAKALACAEASLRQFRALGDRRGEAAALGNMANVYRALGAFARALELYRQALAITVELGSSKRELAGIHRSMGSIHMERGDYKSALQWFEQASAVTAKRNDLEHARSLSAMAHLHFRMRQYTKCLDHHARAIEIYKRVGAIRNVVSALGSMGAAHSRLADHGRALRYFEEERSMAVEQGDIAGEAHGLFGAALAHWERGDPSEAIRLARLSVERLPGLFRHLGDEQGAAARERWAPLLEVGVLAAIRLDDTRAVSFFLESGRAGSLLESLGNRDALARTRVSPPLKSAEDQAHAAIVAAAARHEHALKTGKRKRIRATRAALDEARTEVLRVAAEMQRSAKATADVVYPKAAPLGAIQGQLAADEALISYALLSKYAVALVVTQDKARVVTLARVRAVGAALNALRLPDKDVDPSAPLAALRRKVVEPLGLTPAIKRVLISPHQRLGYVPFSLLVGDREVVYVPSGTTYGILRDEHGKRGRGVLALGDPDYGTGPGEKTLALIRGGAELAPLPATRKEVEAIGDVLLLGKHANETALRDAIEGRKRWRAVHLACHGLVNPERPQLSSLALARTDGADGALTTLEVFGMRIPADLVVLSACETGKGKIYPVEGIVGFTRAFMFAGAPRVLVSLWKVDDAATKALMVKFYELWNPKDGKKGLAAARALREAQKFVASHAKWRHPFYWAAWQLWGLPE